MILQPIDFIVYAWLTIAVLFIHPMDAIWPAREPGKWIFHCHIPHHTLNNDVDVREPAGLP